jgi:hypothetical protein
MNKGGTHGRPADRTGASGRGAEANPAHEVQHTGPREAEFEDVLAWGPGDDRVVDHKAWRSDLALRLGRGRGRRARLGRHGRREPRIASRERQHRSPPSRRHTGDAGANGSESSTVLSGRVAGPPTRVLSATTTKGLEKRTRLLLPEPGLRSAVILIGH